MLFVSKFARYRHVINPGTMRWVKDSSGSERQIDNGDFFWAEFATGGLDLHDQTLALQAFRDINPNNPLGAEPIMIDGTINQMDAATEGEVSNAHEAYFPWQRLSRYDTEDGRQCPTRWREATEECLLASPDFGRDFLRLDLLNLIPPWPTYDEMAPDEIVPFAIAGGYELDLVLRYEKATKKRKEVGVPLKVALDRQRELRAEQAALTVTA